MAQEIKPSEATKNLPRPSNDPFAEVRSEFDRLFSSLVGRSPAGTPGLARSGFTFLNLPSIDLKENDREYVVEAELPGLKKDDIVVIFDDGVLTLKGEKKQEVASENDDVHFMERSFGRFQRSFQLSSAINANAIEAKFEDGVLSVSLPKAKDSQSTEKRIAIS